MTLKLIRHVQCPHKTVVSVDGRIYVYWTSPYIQNKFDRWARWAPGRALNFLKGCDRDRDEEERLKAAQEK